MKLKMVSFHFPRLPDTSPTSVAPKVKEMKMKSVITTLTIFYLKQQTNSVAFSPQANHTDWATEYSTPSLQYGLF
jgi:hypothetical protein